MVALYQSISSSRSPFLLHLYYIQHNILRYIFIIFYWTCTAIESISLYAEYNRLYRLKKKTKLIKKNPKKIRYILNKNIKCIKK